MTIFVIISIIRPNGHLLRTRIFEDNNIFTEIVKKLYLIDTSTNVFPSIHVFNSVGTHITLSKNERIKKHKGFMNCSLVLCILIILSTVFLKQHSTLDVFTGFIWRRFYILSFMNLIILISIQLYKKNGFLQNLNAKKNNILIKVKKSSTNFITFQ